MKFIHKIVLSMLCIMAYSASIYASAYQKAIPAKGVVIENAVCYCIHAFNLSPAIVEPQLSVAGCVKRHEYFYKQVNLSTASKPFYKYGIGDKRGYWRIVPKRILVTDIGNRC